MNPQGLGTWALHRAPHIRGQFMHISCYSHLSRVSREQWECQTWNSVERLKLGLEVGCSCAVNEYATGREGMEPGAESTEHSPESTGKGRGAAVSEENRGVSVRE